MPRFHSAEPRHGLRLATVRRPLYGRRDTEQPPPLNRSAIRRRLPNIPDGFLKKPYALVAGWSDGLVPVKGQGIANTDSTWVTDVSGVLKEGLSQVNSYGGNAKAVKYTLTTMPNMVSALGPVSTNPSVAAKDIAMPGHWMQAGFDPGQLHVFDQGLCNAYNFNVLRARDVLFVGRMDNTRQTYVVEDLPIEDKEPERAGALCDQTVRLRGDRA